MYHYIPLPGQYEINEYRIMEEFIYDLPEGRNQDTLERAILGLSLCIVIEFLIDDIGLGMCLGVMMGVSIGPAIDVLRKIRNQRSKRIMMRKNNVLRKYIALLLLFLLFETVAITLWKAKGNLFYLLNFSYIGGCLALGTALFTAGKRYARHFVQLTVGSYMLLYLGVISCENMQIEGFWYYLFLGVFEAATIHYAVAKIFGPLFFNPACSLR